MQQGGVRINNRFRYLLTPWVGASLYRVWGRVGVCPGVGLEGWLTWSAHLSLCGVACSGAGTILYICFQHSIFALGSSEMAVGFFFPFLSFWSGICPNGTCTQLFLVPYSFCVFCCSRRAVSRYKHFSAAAVSQFPGLSHFDHHVPYFLSQCLIEGTWESVPWMAWRDTTPWPRLELSDTAPPLQMLSQSCANEGSNSFIIVCRDSFLTLHCIFHLSQIWKTQWSSAN